MGWLTRTFGQVGVIRFNFTTEDGKSFVAKTPIEMLGVTKEDIEDALKKMVYVEKGVRCSSLEIVGFYEG